MPQPVAVIGAGWSGLAAALRLSEAGCPVVLVEAARQLGGRARTLRVQGAELDNGQHVLVGACRATLDLIGSLGGDPERLFEAVPLGLQMHPPGGDPWRFQPRSSRPWHWLRALLATDPPLPLGARLRQAWGAGRLLSARLSRDLPVREWLERHRQGASLQEFLWDPLCLAVMNTPPETASAKIFQNVLRQTLLSDAAAARVLLPRVSLGRLLPEPAERVLCERGVALRTGQRVTAIAIDPSAGLRIELRGGDSFAASAVVVATSPRAAGRLLAGRPGLERTVADLNRLPVRSICTIFLRYSRPLPPLPPLAGLVRQLGQWAIPRAISGEPNWLAVVVSAADPADFADRDAVIARLGDELAGSLPGLGKPEAGAIICEKQATLDAVVGLDALRPAIRAARSGVYLAGDFCVPGLPSTLEAAVLGGQAAAAAVLDDLYPGGVPG